ncbi:hypothetical protein [Fulvimarina sp. MAC3]|uniref:hypothetical protein n=1 Tax=Fulvimarina sp. MAC3 TaxID=3148887 RepID=UPI0031FBE77A
MDTWTTYRLQDFLLFSERTYRRLFEAQNEAWWPLPIVLATAGALLVAVFMRRARFGVQGGGSIAWVVTAVALAFVATTFLQTRYAAISPIAEAGYYGFLIEAFALAFVASKPPDTNGMAFPRIGIGFALSAIGLIVYPAIGYLRTGALTGAEWFGTVPDPTAITLLGILSIGIVNRLQMAALMLIPAIWLVFSALTLQAFGDLVSWLIFGSIVLAAAALFIPARAHTKSV